MRGYILETDGPSCPSTLADGLHKVSDNIRNALLTPKGIRPNLPMFGSRLHLLQFEPLDQNTLDLIHFCIHECIRDSIDDVLVESIEYDISYQRRTIVIHIVFRDTSRGLSGRTSVVFSKGVFE
jgi:hypothetical protein